MTSKIKENNINLGTINVTFKTGEEPFTAKNKSIGHNVLSFWQWYTSDLVTNITRGVLAEFIVALAIGKTKEPRLEWDATDLTTDSGAIIEVKSSAYIQSWDQEKYSDISFGIQKTKGWTAKTNKYSDELKRNSDVYVFCVLKEKDQDKVNPLNLDQWDFYVLATSTLNSIIPNQKSLALSSLLKLKPYITGFDGLHDAIESVE